MHCRTVYPRLPSRGIDPLVSEKPYTEKLEGVSIIMKSTSPDCYGKKRFTCCYPAVTATVVNLPEPAVTYADWFSYKMEFLSENREIYRVIRGWFIFHDS